MLRQPAVFLAIALATAVLAIAAASGLLFVSTLDTASLQAQAEQNCPERAMPAFSAQVSNSAITRAQKLGVRMIARPSSLATPYSVRLGFATVHSLTVTLYSRDGALDHVRKLRGAGGPGVWIPDDFATLVGVQPGGYLRTATGARIRVAGIYRSLAPDPFQLSNIPRYFCNWSDLIAPNLDGPGVPFLISDDASVIAASEPSFSGQLSFYQPLPSASTSVDQAVNAIARMDAAKKLFFSSNSGVGGVAAPFDLPNAAAPSANSAALQSMINAAHRSRSGVSGSVLPIDLAGVVVATLLVAAAATFWATHRAREIRLLVSRGVSPLALAGKALLETLPPAVLGLVAGTVLAVELVRDVSPTRIFEPGAITRAVLAACCATAVGLGAIAAIAFHSSRDDVVGGRRPWHRRVPWEWLLLAVAVLLGYRTERGPGVTVDHAIIRVPPDLVTFPMVGSLAALLVAGRIFALAVATVRRHVRGGGPVFYLALRRIAGSRAICVGLLVSVAVPTALLTYTSALIGSVHQELAAKYRTNVGAPIVYDLIGVGAKPLDLKGQGSQVASYQIDGRLPGDTQVNVLGVDPRTFDDFALVDAGQRGLVRRLHSQPDGAPTAALLINADGDRDTATLTIGHTVLRLDIVARSAVFPGLRVGNQPLVIVDRSALSNVDPNADRIDQVWTSPSHAQSVLRLLRAEGVSVLVAITPTELINTTGLLPLTWIFSYLRALAAMVGLVAIVGLVFAIAARSRRRTVSYIISRRMGLTRAQHLRSQLLEIATVVGLGFVLGAGVGLAAFEVIARSLDMYPSLPPGARLDWPISTWLATGGVWILVIMLASASVQLLADHANPAQVLRLE